MIGFVIFGAMTYVSGLAASFTMFLIIRALAGIGQGAYYGPQYALSGEAIPTKNLTLGTAIINSGMAFGTSGGYLLSSSMVLENGQHWSRPFFIMSIPTIIVGILFYVILKEKVIRPEDQNLTEEEIQAKGKNTYDDGDQSKISLGSIFKNRNLLGAFLLVFASIYANFVIITWLPTFLIQERGFEGTSVGFISSLVPWASIPGALFFAFRADKMKNSKRMVYILAPIAAFSVFMMAFVTDRSLLILMLIIYGLTGKLAMDPIMVAFVSRNAPRRALGTALSAYNFVGMSGSILSPYFTGWVSDVTGSMQIGFYLAAALLIVGLLLFSVLTKDEPTTI